MNRERWTEEEDIILLQAQLDYGNKWVEIMKKLKGRSENSIKNRYNTLYKKFLDENELIAVADVNCALEAVMKEKNEARNWIKKALEQKRRNRNFGC